MLAGFFLELKPNENLNFYFLHLHLKTRIIWISLGAFLFAQFHFAFDTESSLVQLRFWEECDRLNFGRFGRLTLDNHMVMDTLQEALDTDS